jgi:hypothetical protein
MAVHLEQAAFTGGTDASTPIQKKLKQVESDTKAQHNGRAQREEEERALREREERAQREREERALREEEERALREEEERALREKLHLIGSLAVNDSMPTGSVDVNLSVTDDSEQSISVGQQQVSLPLYLPITPC